jgi:hypothetical protein
MFSQTLDGASEGLQSRINVLFSAGYVQRTRAGVDMITLVLPVLLRWIASDARSLYNRIQSRHYVCTEGSWC